MNDQHQKCIELGNCFEFMPDSDQKHDQSELPHLFLKHLIADSVTFFGGSFNPFHKGHRACLDLCPEKNILIVPDCNPLKQTPQDLMVYSKVFELAQQLKETPYSIYPGFLGKNKPNPTSLWLPLVRIKEKNFLMGDDSFMDLLKWKNPGMIISSLTKLYVVSRKFTREDYAPMEKEILKFNPHLKIIYLGEHAFQDVSSTGLRK